LATDVFSAPKTGLTWTSLVKQLPHLMDLGGNVVFVPSCEMVQVGTLED